jgi:hypothetical protein
MPQYIKDYIMSYPNRTHHECTHGWLRSVSTSISLLSPLTQICHLVTKAWLRSAGHKPTSWQVNLQVFGRPSMMQGRGSDGSLDVATRLEKQIQQGISNDKVSFLCSVLNMSPTCGENKKNEDIHQTVGVMHVHQNWTDGVHRSPIVVVFTRRYLLINRRSMINKAWTQSHDLGTIICQWNVDWLCWDNNSFHWNFTVLYVLFYY